MALSASRRRFWKLLRLQQEEHYLKGTAMQTLHSSDCAEGERETIPARPSAMSLSSESRRCRGGRGLDKARRGGGEADVRLGDMESTGIAIASLAVLVALGGIRWGNGELGRD